nr:RecName: Full=Oxygen-evolving enhancer protein 2; Short=OEE2; AltName: Full=24 kDa subunit of oxygen evolving system of photosystem II [Physcomitrium patens]
AYGESANVFGAP